MTRQIVAQHAVTGTWRLARGVCGAAAVAFIGVLLGACTETPGPEAVALEYGRALYASDVERLWPRISLADRRLKDEQTFRRQHPAYRPVARAIIDQLARYVTAIPLKTAISGDRATVALRFRLPDANAPEIRTLARDWDEDVLERLSRADQQRVRERLDSLHRAGRLPTLEGEEALELVREAGTWKIFLNWAGGVQLRFASRVDADVPLEVTVTPAEVVLARGERVAVTVRARNTGRGETTTRVGHRIEPEADSRYLALLICPLYVPVTLAPGESREFRSEYLLAVDAPNALRSLSVQYVFPAASDVAAAGGEGLPVPLVTARMTAASTIR